MRVTCPVNKKNTRLNKIMHQFLNITSRPHNIFRYDAQNEFKACSISFDIAHMHARSPRGYRCSSARFASSCPKRCARWGINRTGGHRAELLAVDKSPLGTQQDGGRAIARRRVSRESGERLGHRSRLHVRQSGSGHEMNGTNSPRSAHACRHLSKGLSQH